MDYGTFQPVLDFLKVFVEESHVAWIAGVAFLNVVVAVAAALKNGEFQAQKLGEFLWKKVGLYGAVYAIAWMVSEAMGDTVPEAGLVSAGVFAVLQGMLVADLVESLSEMGVPMPEGLKSIVNKSSSNCNGRC